MLRKIFAIFISRIVGKSPVYDLIFSKYSTWSPLWFWTSRFEPRRIWQPYKDRINRFFKFSFQILNLLIYLLFYSFYIFYLMERPGASEYRTLRLVIALPLYIFFIETEIIHTTISWMICSRFKHLNRTIKHLNQDIILNSYKLKLIIEWFSRNIEQMTKFNRIFSSVMCVFFVRGFKASNSDRGLDLRLWKGSNKNICLWSFLQYPQNFGYFIYN